MLANKKSPSVPVELPGNGGFKTSNTRWRRYRVFHKRRIPACNLDWLLEPGSLTQRLIQTCGCRPFRVKVLGENYRYAALDEALALGVPNGTRVVVREVQLLCNETPWVYARSLIPVTSLEGRLRRLKRQGSRSLGATLFADPGLQRGPLEICRVDAGEVPADAESKNAEIWGRRSIFYVQDRPLLVSEYFLPALFENAQAK